jgi:multiple sugar transport system permease protein
MLGLSFVILYPLLYMLSVTFRSPAELYDPTVVWIPKTLTFQNLRYVLFESGVAFLPSLKGGLQPGALLRSFLLALSCTVLQVFATALAGYGFARFKFRGRGVLFALALFTLLVPPSAINMPVYVNYVGFQRFTQELLGGEGIPIIDTFIPVALPALFGVGIRAGLFIYLFRQYFKNLPPALEEAAYLDGCGPAAAYFRIMLVNAGPILLVSFLFSFVWYWNDYLNVSLFFNSARPMSIELSNFWNYLNYQKLPDGSAIARAQMGVYVQAAALLFIAPVLAIYVALQRLFMQSVVTAGIVG